MRAPTSTSTTLVWGDDLIADADQSAEAPPAWLNYDGLPGSGADDDDVKRNRRGGQTTL